MDQKILHKLELIDAATFFIVVTLLASMAYWLWAQK